MTKIHTLTLNPAVDIDFTKEQEYAGGKGINVSRALKNLGVGDVITYTFAGGLRGIELCDLMEKAGLRFEAVIIRDSTRRTIIKQANPEIKDSTESYVDEKELTELVQRIDSNISTGDYLVLAGSLPQGIVPGIYAHLTVRYKVMGVNVILDASQEQPLKYGIQAGPYLAKPNAAEWQMITCTINCIPEMLQKAIKKYNMISAMAMQGEKGLTMATNSSIVHAVPPSVDVKCTVGCGDAVTAGFLYGKLNGFSDEELARFAVACGTASAEKDGTELCTLEDAVRIAEEVTVE